MYDTLYDDVGVLDPCTEPAYGALHYGLTWDARNRKHFRDNLRLSPAQVDAGISAGYYSLGLDEEHCEPEDAESCPGEYCRYKYLFRPEPSLLSRELMPVYCLILTTAEGTLRPLTTFKASTAEQAVFIKEAKGGNLE